jgi:hypothetical protein
MERQFHLSEQYINRQMWRLLVAGVVIFALCSGPMIYFAFLALSIMPRSMAQSWAPGITIGLTAFLAILFAVAGKQLIAGSSLLRRSALTITHDNLVIAYSHGKKIIPLTDIEKLAVCDLDGVDSVLSVESSTLSPAFWRGRMVLRGYESARQIHDLLSSLRPDLQVEYRSSIGVSPGKRLLFLGILLTAMFILIGMVSGEMNGQQQFVTLVAAGLVVGVVTAIVKPYKRSNDAGWKDWTILVGMALMAALLMMFVYFIRLKGP